MGMFDYVKYKAKCKKCGALISDFQSKDYKCQLYRISPHRVESFYSDCPKCHEWNEYEVVPFSIRLKN